MNGKEQTMEETRDKIQKWLMSEGWQISEPTHPEFVWLIQAEDGGERRILVGQNKAKPDQIHLEARVNLAEEHQKMFETLAADRRRETLWKLRFRLLAMNVHGILLRPTADSLGGFDNSVSQYLTEPFPLHQLL